MTIKDLILEVRRLAHESPDAIYDAGELNGCMYTKIQCGKGVGCIFGQALLNLVPIYEDTLKEFDNVTQFDTGGDSSINYVLKELNIETSNNELSWCCLVQKKQDNGNSWANTIKSTDDEFENPPYLNEFNETLQE